MVYKRHLKLKILHIKILRTGKKTHEKRTNIIIKKVPKQNKKKMKS